MNFLKKIFLKDVIEELNTHLLKSIIKLVKSFSYSSQFNQHSPKPPSTHQAKSSKEKR